MVLSNKKKVEETSCKVHTGVLINSIELHYILYM